MKYDTDYEMYDFKNNAELLNHIVKQPINAKVDQENFDEVIKRLENMVFGEFIDLYKVTGCDFNDHQITVGYTFKYDQAIELAKGKGSWGSDGYVERSTFFKRAMNDGTFKYYEFKEIFVKDPISEKQIKEKALAKLTPEEIKILGLDK